MADVAGAQNIAKEFARHYYATFDSNRLGLRGLYEEGLSLVAVCNNALIADGHTQFMFKIILVDVSIMTFEGGTVMGGDQIMEKLSTLPFKSVAHIVTCCDGQPTVDNGIIIHVLGQLKTDEDAPHGFSETFYLKMNEMTKSYVILNHVFRLNIHNIPT